MNMPEIERRESLWGRKVPLITAVSIFTYILTYVYQLSFSYVLEFPSDFILVDISSLLKTLSFTGVASIPVFIAIVFSLKIYRLNRFWLSFVLMAVVAVVLYILFVGFVNPKRFYIMGGKSVIFAISFIAFYPLLLTWQMLMDGHKSLRSLSDGSIILVALFTILCTSSIAQISAWVSSGKYSIKEMPSYYLVNNVGEKILVGKCDAKKMEYKLLDADKDLTFIKSSTDERNAFRSCVLNIKDKSK